MEKRFTKQDIEALRYLADKGDVQGYWQYQANKGSALGALSLNAATNQGMDGCTANEFLKIRAAKAGQPLMPQDMDELRQGFMRGDFGARNAAFLSGTADGGYELGARAVQGYHADVLKQKGYGADLWTPQYLIEDHLANGNDAAADRELRYISESGPGKYFFYGLGTHGLAMGDAEAGIPGDMKAAAWLADTSRAGLSCAMPGARAANPLSNSSVSQPGDGRIEKQAKQNVPYTPLDDDEKPQPWQAGGSNTVSSSNFLPDGISEETLREQRLRAMHMLLDR